jgi:hypothetical protein
MKERFIEFLEKNNCLEQYKANLVNEKKNFDEHLNKTWQANPSWVTSAFTWMPTKEGDRFWRDLQEEWEGIALKFRREEELNSNN